MRSTFAEINLSFLKLNYLNIRKKIGDRKVMAVVKADAYGHGVERCVKTLNSLKDKPEYYAVAYADEGIELRKLEIKEPILVFEPVNKYNAASFLKNNLIPTVFEKRHIKLLQDNVRSNMQELLPVHVKIDTGMGRLGIPFDKAAEFIEWISKLKGFKIDGIYTHFATSDEKHKSFAKLQLKRFSNLVEYLRAFKINYGLAHCANSGAIIDMPDAYFDMVRPGISLYGYYPSLETSESIRLKPVMAIISKIESIKEISKGESVSYGRKFIVKRDTVIASVPLGYADGFPRNLTNNARVIINGSSFNQIGTVTMDRIMVEIGKSKNEIKSKSKSKIKVGDKVILLGNQKGKAITAWDWSKVLKTIPYEITCNISKRVPRVYLS